MATIPKARCGVAYTISGNSPKVVYLQEGTPTWTSHLGGGARGTPSTGYFKEGALLTLNSTQGLDVVMFGGDSAGSTDPGTGFDQSRKRIVGFAMEDGTGTTANTVAIAAANSDTVFYGNTASSVSTATATISIIDIGETQGASMNGSRFYVNVNASVGGSLLRIIAKHDADAYGDVNGRCLFQFVPASRLWE